MGTNQTSAILAHLRKNKSITSKEAFELYGATRLSAIIFNLRKNHDILTVMIDGTTRFGDSTKYAKYVYVGELK